MLNQLSIWQKVKLLVTIILLRYGIMKLRRFVLTIPLDNYKKELFKNADWHFLPTAGEHTGIR
jgi:hypothetical protein